MVAAARSAATASVGQSADISAEDPSGDGDGAALGLLYVPKLDASSAGLWSPAFPPADLLDAAASCFERRPAWDGSEGPRAQLVISPGAVAVERHDYARLERAAERAVERRQREVELRAAMLEAGLELPAPTGREVAGWSRRSRARMVRALCELDYSRLLVADRVPAMVTLTYPGDWLTVAPTGRAVKRHLEAFRQRYRRAWGHALVCVWKLEFQRRGAPHFHLLMVPPYGTARGDARSVAVGLPFRAWLSAVWADVVGHPDAVERMSHLAAGTGVDFSEGLRARDPKRVAVYFTKHGSFASKGYQHIVPDEWRAPGAGPGRFWGYWGLRREVRVVEVGHVQVVMLARVLRRWSAAQGTTREVRVGRGRQVRKVRRPVRRLPAGAGWVSVNDGASFAADLARYLSLDS